MTEDIHEIAVFRECLRNIPHPDLWLFFAFHFQKQSENRYEITRYEGLVNTRRTDIAVAATVITIIVVSLTSNLTVATIITILFLFPIILSIFPLISLSITRVAHNTISIVFFLRKQEILKIPEFRAEKPNIILHNLIRIPWSFSRCENYWPQQDNVNG